MNIELENGGVQVAGTNVIKTDLKCAMGVVHAIDTVIFP